MEILTDAGMLRSRGPAAPQPPLTDKGVVLRPSERVSHRQGATLYH
jgi:hypothetical protein